MLRHSRDELTAKGLLRSSFFILTDDDDDSPWQVWESECAYYT